MKVKLNIIPAMIVCASFSAVCKVADENVSNEVLKTQRSTLAKNTLDMGFGPQSPRNIDNHIGKNDVIFNEAPQAKHMNLCNIHFHKNAEHAGGEFSKYAGNGDGHGFNSGYVYTGALTKDELTPTKAQICPSVHGGLNVGDTIEAHYVHSSAKVKPGPTLNSCLSTSIENPSLRVEAQVYVLVNDKNALDFNKINHVSTVRDYYQAVSLPKNTGSPVVYIGSTTGPGYNETASPYQVTWSVKPKVAKVNINSVGKWCEGNIFNEIHAHGVRNLIVNPALLSEIK